MKPAYAREVCVESPTNADGLRWNHPSLLKGVDTLITKGYGNEHICRIIGVPGAIVDTRRSQMKKSSA